MKCGVMGRVGLVAAQLLGDCMGLGLMRHPVVVAGSVRGCAFCWVGITSAPLGAQLPGSLGVGVRHQSGATAIEVDS